MLEQRASAREAALNFDENGNRPPEVRIPRMSISGRLRLQFTTAMINLPSTAEFIDLINSQKDK